MIVNRLLTEDELNTFKLLQNSPDMEDRYLYSEDLELVMNKYSGKLMTYYWDDMPDGYEIPLDKVIFILKGVNIPDKYKKKIVFYNNLYKIKSIKYMFDLEEVCKRSNILRYPQINLLDFKGNSFQVHRLIATIYIPNPNNKPIVNHKGIEKDYSILFKKEDLSWATNKENSLYDRKPPQSKIRYVQIDESGLEVGKRFTVKELKEKFNLKCNISFSKNGNYFLYLGIKYKRIDLNIEEYRDYLINNYISEDVYNKNDNYWKSKIIDGVEVHANLNGVIKFNSLSKEIISIGNINHKGYRRIQINNKVYPVHKIICFIFNDIFVNYNDINLEVDHINSDARCNLCSNLRFATHNDNMNNTNTKKKMLNKYRKVKQYDLLGNFIKVYSSVGEAAKDMGCDNSLICRTAGRTYIQKRVHNGFLWCYEGDENKILEDLRYIFYRIDGNGNIVDSGRVLKEVETDFISHITCLKYVNTGIQAPDGFYYQQGIEDLKNSSGKRVRLRDLLIV